MPKKRRIAKKKPARATGFHIHDALQRPEKRQAVTASALPVVQEEAPDDVISEDDFSEEEDDENEKGEETPAPNGIAPPPAAAAEAFPYGNPADEALQLSLEEAFFLMYGMGVLSVTNEDGVRTLRHAIVW